ncbi:MAG: UDP-N-acetylmuramoyl-L-alanyl-D-glutamate--2,6-diaminopimelate ligase [bacterium]
MKLKQTIKKRLGEQAVLVYHYFLAVLSAVYYRFPSRKMIIIGVTGTKGKTSTANFIWSCLNNGGYKTGLISTANIRIGDKEFLNKYHMTMPGRFTIQKFLSQMVKEEVKCCVVETTSEGIKQYRNKGIFYDIAVFTNLYPEHLGSHGGSFEKYKETKGKLFEELVKSKNKIIDGKKIEKVIIVNSDDENKDYFLNFSADKEISFGKKDGADCLAKDIISVKNGVEFEVDEINLMNIRSLIPHKVLDIEGKYILNILGEFNVYNALPAIVIASLFGIDKEIIKSGLAKLNSIPGRMEQINEGQNFHAIVDYAHEKQSITAVLSAAGNLKVENSKIIILLGAEGGGRDRAKRFAMGEVAASMADFVVVSNVDPYDDDPKLILEDIAGAVEKGGKSRDKNLFVVEDRREGIAKVLSLANENDIVLITGKGAEQSMFVGGKVLAWDDRVVAREEIGKL